MIATSGETHPAGPPLWVCHLGTVEYRAALALQGRVRAARQADAIPDVLLVLDHPAVLTRGRRSAPADLPLGEDFYRARGIDIVDVDRGGRVTFHAPGLLTGYPIMRLDDVLAFLRTMEHAIIAALDDVGVRGEKGQRPTGVWVGEAKIAAIGLHVSRGVSTHGFAINVDNDLEPWSWIVPCGLEAVRITSVREQTGAGKALMPAFRAMVARRFAEAYGREARAVTPAALEETLRPIPSLS
jgi:lipoyl(octanoyl) transferase